MQSGDGLSCTILDVGNAGTTAGQVNAHTLPESCKVLRDFK